MGQRGILGRRPGYVNFTTVFLGCNYMEVQFLRRLLILIDCFKRHQVHTQLPQSKLLNIEHDLFE